MRGIVRPPPDRFDLKYSRYRKRLLTITIYCVIKESAIDSMCVPGENPG